MIATGSALNFNVGGVDRPVPKSREETKHGINRIYIVGGPGSGKSFLASRVAKSWGLNWHDLDDDALTALSSAERIGQYEHIRTSPAWICEAARVGLESEWVASADLVIFLVTPRTWRVVRILWRSLLKCGGVRFRGQLGRDSYGALRYRVGETWYYQERRLTPFIAECSMWIHKIHQFSSNTKALHWVISQGQCPNPTQAKASSQN